MPRMDAPLKVLLIDDDEDERSLLAGLLSQAPARCELDWAPDFESGLARLLEGRHDAVLLDYRLGARDGLELLEASRAAGARTPVIMLTGGGDRELDLKAMAAGAADYLEKGALSAALIERSVRYAVERARARELLLRSERFSAMGQLAAGVVHDLSNPLSIVLGYAGNLLETKPRPEALVDEGLRAIAHAAERCRLLVRQLLEFSRGGGPASEDFDLRDVVGQALDLIHSQARTQRVSLRRDLGDRVLPVHGHRAQLGQVVVNLCVNALDVMPKGGNLSVTMRRDGGGAAVLRVEDSGPGIPPELLPRVFEPFVSTKAPGKGTGLGLALVSLIAERHGGAVRAESPAGHGASFTVSLPLKEAA